MGRGAGAVAGWDFRKGAHDIEAGRKIDGLERRALDAGLLRHRRNDDDRRNGGRNDERFLKHGWSSLDLVKHRRRGRTPGRDDSPLPIRSATCSVMRTNSATGTKLSANRDFTSRGISS